MTLSNVDWNALSGRLSPYFYAGIWDNTKEAAVSIYSHEGLAGHSLHNMSWPYEFLNPSDTHAKIGFVIDQANETGPNQNTELYVGSASVQLSDTDVPTIFASSGPAQWMNQEAQPVAFTASDSGLGVQSLIATPEGLGQPSWKTAYGCIGVGDAACPRTWKSTEPGHPALRYEPAAMPQGVDYLGIVSEDPVANKSSTAWVPVKVDHTLPSIAFSGSVVEQSKTGTYASEYSLNYVAKDGDSSAATTLAPLGSAGTGEGKMEAPQGVAVDQEGNTWVADKINNRIEKFDAAGKFLMQFGAYGSGNGKFSQPKDIAVAPNNTLWVAESGSVTEPGNRRLQQFTATGGWIRKIAYSGFVTPTGVAVDATGNVWVTDPGAQRVFEFSEQGTLLRTGATSPALLEPTGIDIDAQGNVWVVDTQANQVLKYDAAGNFLLKLGGGATGLFDHPYGIAVAPSGNLIVIDGNRNRIQEIQPNGTPKRQLGSTGSGTGQLLEPRGIAVASDGTAYVADTGNHRIARWSHADLNPQSGVSSTEVKVDGQLIEKYAPGCSTENCQISRPLTLKNSDYSSGTHKVEVIATDAVGLKYSKEITFKVDRAAPHISTLTEFFNAPEGWLEQKPYEYMTYATDSESGVIELSLKIDGKTVAVEKQPSCIGGGCAAMLYNEINTATYKGGAHPAEIVATDAAGNVARKAWTINVDPKGEITASEAANTLDAADSTNESNIVAPTSEIISAVERAEGNNPTLTKSPTGLISSGIPDPTLISTGPEDGFIVRLPEGSISAEPTGVAENATEMAVAEEGVAVGGNTNTNVDSVMRPTFDGLLTFESIRDASARETFSWKIDLGEGQILRSIDPLDAEVDYQDGHEAYLISAEPASDAVGTGVPTSLSVSDGDVITLTVRHKEGSYVYPVVAGTGWEGGFMTEVIAGPHDEQEEREEQERLEREKQEALEREWVEGEEPSESELSPELRATASISVVDPPEMVDYMQRKRRSKARAAYCSSWFIDPCSVWETEVLGTWFWNGTKGEPGGYAWRGDTTLHCDVSSNPVIYNNAIRVGWAGGNPAPYGYGEYVDEWCNFETAFLSPEDTSQDTFRQIQNHLFGDGYQRQHIHAYGPE